MNPVQTSDTSTGYSPLEPTWVRKKVIRPRSMSLTDSEDILIVDPFPKHTNKRGLYSRAIGFILFETLFLAFAYHCLLHPIPLQSHPDNALDILPTFNITLTEFKAGIAAVSVVWHALACLLIGDIIAVVRSAEFMAQYHRLGGLNPKTSDRVSTLTSGLLDNIVHLVRGSPTGAFRLALVVMLILTVVGPLGSGTITVGTITTTTRDSIQVTNMTFDMMQDTITRGWDRLTLIMRLEREENITYKYDMSSSLRSDPVLIPWPKLDINLPEQSTLIYESDVLHFHFQCTWVAPSSVSTGGFPNHTDLITIKNQTYIREGIFPDATEQYGILPLYGHKHRFLSTTLLFFTYQGFDPSEGPGPTNMTFSGLPYVFPLGTDRNYIRTGAILHCNPIISILPATVTLAQNSLVATGPPTSTKGSTPIGNISPEGAAALIADTLTSTIDNYPQSADKMLLKIRRIVENNIGLHTAEQEPLSLEEMASNIGLYMKSAGKGVLGGITLAQDALTSYLVTTHRTAEITFPVAALVSSKPFLIAFTAVIGLIVMVLAALLWTIRQTELSLFNLANVAKIVVSKQ